MIVGMKTCPTCGKAMEIRSSKEHAREWRCTDYRSSGGSCLTALEIAGDEHLSIGEIAGDMALQAFSSSAEEGRKQAGYRRTAGFLKKLGPSYLSHKERHTIRDAIDILERLGTSAEIVKRERKRFEHENRRRVDQRYMEASTLIAKIFKARDDVVELAIDALTIGPIVSTLDTFAQVELFDGRVIRRISGKGVLTKHITREYNDVCGALVCAIAGRCESVEKMVKNARDRFNEQRESVRITNKALIEEIRTAIAVDSGANVERIGKR